jgi:sporulation integral membrane protein YlbJ
MLKKRAVGISSALSLGAISLLAFVLIIAQTDVAIEYMNKGLKLCAENVIPSLFPFMVISELIVRSGIGVRLSRVLSHPIKMLFGVGEASACAYILGVLCGFPIGAKTAVSMYDSGMMTKRELERTMTFCNNPGSAFVISAVGSSLLGNKSLGILIFCCVMLSSVIVGIMSRIFMSRKEDIVVHAHEDTVGAEIDVSIFTSAIQSSATSMLIVCSYVAFFSVIVGCIGSALAYFHIPDTITSCIFGFFELSSGVGAAAAEKSAISAVLLCAAFCGWSGLSVHCQVMTVAAGRGISFKPYIIAKAVQGLVCSALAGIGLKIFFPNADEITIPSVSTIDPSNRAFMLCLLFFATSICPVLINFSFWNKGENIFCKILQKNSKNT